MRVFAAQVKTKVLPALSFHTLRIGFPFTISYVHGKRMSTMFNCVLMHALCSSKYVLDNRLRRRVQDDKATEKRTNKIYIIQIKQKSLYGIFNQ